MKPSLLSFLLILSIFLCLSCSSNDTEVIDNPKENEEQENNQENGEVDDFTSVENLSDELEELINNDSDISYKELQQQLRSRNDVKSSEVKDSVLHVYMKSGLQLQVDLYGEFLLSDDENTDYESIDVDEMLDDLTKALEIDEDEDEYNVAPAKIKGSDAASLNSSSAPMKTAKYSKERIMQRNNVLIWAPWEGHDDQLDDFHSGLRDVMNSFQPLMGINEYTYKSDMILSKSAHPHIEDLQTFSNYGLVILVCHGTKEGLMALPMTNYWQSLFTDSIKGDKKDHKIGENIEYYLSNGLVGTFLCRRNEKTGKKRAECKGILLNPKFPNLSNTIMWTCMCYAAAPNSAIQKAASNSDVADFMGATNKVSGSLAFSTMQVWASTFFNRGYGGASSDDAYSAIPNHKYKNMKITRGGDNCFFYDYNGNKGAFLQKSKGYALSYRIPIARESMNGSNPNADVYTATTQNPNNGRRANGQTVQVSTSEISGGFYVTNQETKVSKHIPFSEKDKVKSATYENIITRLHITGNTDDLDEGKYTYKTYFKFGDEIVYSKQEYSFEVKKDLYCPDSNHPHLIDLGLPSGTKWACCNVGASSPEQYGGYYAWGETSEKSVYYYETYKYFDYAAYQNGKDWSDCFQSLGSDIAGTSYDVAHVKWGGKYRMPSYDQCKELVNKCSYKWTTLNGINGGQFTGPSGGTIFMPAAGDRWDDGLDDAGSYGYYWSSTQGPSPSYNACHLYFRSGYADYYYWHRYGGHSVRPVAE